MNEPRSPRFYFALPRLLAKMCGGDASRAEQNSAEAWSAHLAIYLISYLYFAGFIPKFMAWPARVPIFIAFPFFVWLFWLIVLYLNSLILKAVRSLPIRRGQGVLIVALATAMAVVLLQRGSISAEIGAIWLTATTMNLVAAAVLALSNGEPARQ
jgi:hypothetical protein